METKMAFKNTQKFNCDLCDFNCNKKSEWNRHIKRKKHLVNINGNNVNKIAEKNAENAENLNKENYQCNNCYKTYKCRSGLWKHKQKCVCLKEQKQDETKELKELVVKLMVENQEMKNTMLNENIKLQQQNFELQKQNQDIQKHVLDVCKVTNSCNTINSHNKTFNLQFFLNEQCKDAMNITDFVNSVTLQLADLEKIGSLGYVNGISSIIIKELKGLDITKRPVHCSDAEERNSLYKR